ncbi:hypothetical protein QBC44DRAFT_304818 [Cladorrhinum sp. PSN332]|nr:hypothetical protein QBC44DRAFT_304818 [Cladorrhinum sp. PSN332]
MDHNDDFFKRNNLAPETKSQCLDFIKTLRDPASSESQSSDIEEHRSQGYCSYTLQQLSHPPLIIQFRPASHRLNLDITSHAHALFPCIAPVTKFLGVLPDSQLHVYSHTTLPGKPLLCSSSSSLALSPFSRHNLIKSLARVFTTTYKNNNNNNNNSSPQPNKPQKGKIGSSLLPRLQTLHTHLPKRFKPTVKKAIGALDSVENGSSLPWVLTHGDLVPSNILIDPETGEITGLIDWAEGEYLPFGMGFVGLEEILGYRIPVTVTDDDDDDDDDGKHKGVVAKKINYPAGGTRFRYVDRAEELRTLFWDEMCSAVPEMNHQETREKVEISRVIGGLLWHGFAFDNGALDRVVAEGRDDQEIQMLDMFLFGKDTLDREGDSQNAQDTAEESEEDEAKDWT